MTQTSWNGTQDDNCSSCQCHAITDAGLPRVSCKEEEVTLPEAQVAALSLLPRGSLPTPQPSQAQPPLPTDLRAYRAPHDPKTSPLHTPSAYVTLLKEQTNQATTWHSSSGKASWAMWRLHNTHPTPETACVRAVHVISPDGTFVNVTS